MLGSGELRVLSLYQGLEILMMLPQSTYLFCLYGHSTLIFLMNETDRTNLTTLITSSFVIKLRHICSCRRIWPLKPAEKCNQATCAELRDLFDSVFLVIKESADFSPKHIVLPFGQYQQTEQPASYPGIQILSDS